MPTTDLTTKLAELQGVIAKGGITRLSDSETVRQAIEALRLYDAAKAQPKQAAEPVAWGMLDKETGLILDVICPATHDELEGDYTIPLYAAPVAQAEPQDEIDKLREELANTKDALAALCKSVHEFNLGRSMFPKQTSGTSEPVAWRLKSPPGSTYTAVFNPGKPDAQTLEYWRRNGGEIEYAYAAPVAQAEFICRKCGLRQEGEKHVPDF